MSLANTQISTATRTNLSRASHNRVGQKLGRKGQETRERIVAAMLKQVSDPNGPPLTLSSVAKEASVGLPNLYLYFPDLGELLLAALSRVMETAEEAYVDRLRDRWPDEALREACFEFLCAHFAFWERNARILHMRNALADAGDLRLLHYRNRITRPLIDLLNAQMDINDEGDELSRLNTASVLFTGIERIATVATNPHFSLVTEISPGDDQAKLVRGLIEAEAEVIAQTIAAKRRVRTKSCAAGR